MKNIGKALFGAVIGFFSAYGVLAFSDYTFASDVIIGTLLAISAVLGLLSFVRWKQVKKLYFQNVQGDAEDRVEE